MEGARAYFAKRAPRYCQGNWQRRGIHPQEQMAVEDLPPGLDVAVDLGSGQGTAVRLLSTKARSVYAIDISKEMMSSQAGDAQKIVADAHDMPLASGSVDLVFARMSIHYMDLGRLKTELVRVLAPEGYFLVVSAFPYSQNDEAWFNQRHVIKRKPFAFTPTVDALVGLLAPEFTLIDSRTWTQASLTSRTIASHEGDAWAANLRAHIESAPAGIQRRYQATVTDEGDLSLTFFWAALTFHRSTSAGDRRHRPASVYRRSEDNA
jgi:ubiquinone/menaquinone biosynthesis C-methylase UbiE